MSSIGQKACFAETVILATPIERACKNLAKRTSMREYNANDQKGPWRTCVRQTNINMKYIRREYKNIIDHVMNVRTK